MRRRQIEMRSLLARDAERRAGFRMMLLSAVLAAVAVTNADAQTPLGTVFTYQGQLKLLGSAVNDTADFEFSLYDGPGMAAALVAGPAAVDGVMLTDGLFTVELDFGAAAFAGDERWLAISVRSPAGMGLFTTLAPRQRVSATPYALHALKAPWAGLTGVPAGFADGTDDAGGLTLPYAGSTASAGPAFSIGNTGAGNGGLFTAAGSAAALEAVTSGSLAMKAEAPGTGVALLGIGTVLGSAGSSAAGTAGVHGEATNAAGVTYGVQGDTSSSTDGAVGVRGHAQAGAGETYGVQGISESASDNASGVYGKASAASGQTIGVWGQSSSAENNASGVFGEALAGTGITQGVAGTTNSITPNASGVKGFVRNCEGKTYGVIGLTCSTTDFTAGVRGEATASSGKTRGVEGETGSTNADAYGVSGRALAGATKAVHGENLSTAANAVGVEGICSLTNIFVANFGVRGTTHSQGNGAAGVHGIADGANGDVFGVLGETASASSTAAGVKGKGSAGGSPGVLGVTSAAINGAIAVQGTADAAATGNAVGVRGQSLALVGENVGVYGSVVSSANGSAGVKGIASAANGEVAGVSGVCSSSTNGSAGVKGSATAATGEVAGVFGESLSSAGYGVYGRNNVGTAGFFENTDEFNTESTLRSASNSSSGNAIEAMMTGLGTAGFFTNSNEDNGLPAIRGATNGIAQAAFFQIDNSENADHAVEATTNGTGSAIRAETTGQAVAGFFELLNPNSTSATILARNAGSGTAIVAEQNGSTITGNPNPALRATVTHSFNESPAIEALTFGKERAGFFEVRNTMNIFPALEGLTDSPEGAGVVGRASAETGDTYGVEGSSASDSSMAAGVLAKGDGSSGGGMPKAAALEIRNGAIRVSGGDKPAGTIVSGSGWTTVYSWNQDGAPIPLPCLPPGCPLPGHCHPIGASTEVTLNNNLIVAGGPGVGSIILLTVGGAPTPASGAFATLVSKDNGTATIRVTAFGGTCMTPVAYAGSVHVHYLIINN